MSKLEANIKWLEGTLSLGQAGKHTLTIDRLESAGGTDAGFRGGELLLVSLGGCLSSTLAGAAIARNISLTKMNTHVTSSEAQNPNRISQLDVEVDLAATDSTGTQLSDEELDKLLTVAERGCLVTNTLRAGLPINIRRVNSKLTSLT